MVQFDRPIPADGGGQRILLVGDISQAFLDADVAARNHYEVCDNISGAVDVASKDSFISIGVVMHGISRLESALQALREKYDARIILLAQMYEEPIAIRLVGSTFNGATLADDYLICPIEADKFSDLRVGLTSIEHRASSIELDTTIEKRIRALEKLATEDDLTGLKNRRYIWEFSRQIIERAKTTNEQVTLLVFDIDNFKHYNDVYGHLAGDEILKQAAVLMRRCCRKHDVVGRIGGDEFAVVFWDGGQAEPSGPGTERRSAAADHPKEAIFIAKRFRKEFEKAELHLLGPEGKGTLTISGGLAGCPRGGSTVQKLFQQADEALLDAKRSGKNRIYLVGRPEKDIADIE
jgi:two-component system cell cycle response regulator